MLSTITDIISIITVAQLLLFSVFLLTYGKRTAEKVTLAVFLSSNGIFILNFIITHYAKELSPFGINFFFIGASFGFLFGPLLYFYTKIITEKKFVFTWKSFLHLIPFLISAIVILYMYQFQSYEHKLEILQTGLFSGRERNIFILSMNLITFVYLYKSFQILQIRNRNLMSYYSSTTKISLNWLKLIITAFFLMWMTDLISWLLSTLHLSTIILRETLTFISLFINFVFANLLIFKNLHPVQLEGNPVISVEKAKYENSALTDEEKKTILFRLENLMSREKLYLDPSLNLGEVAQKLNVIPRYLSQAINEIKKQNFYDFVNTYRIDEVKKLLTDPEYENEKILSILYDSGFNSKSVFNTTFKKFTGLTPSEYRKKNLRSVKV